MRWCSLIAIGAAALMACGASEEDARSSGASDGSAAGGSGADGGSAAGGLGGSGTSMSGAGGSAAGSSGSGGSAQDSGPTDLCADAAQLAAGGQPFDCGSSGYVFQDSGRPDNRVNYVIVGDGYTEAQLDTLFISHIENMLNHEQTGRFSPLGEPYVRYRNFVNICGLKVASNEACIDNEDIGRLCDTAFDGRCVTPCSGSTATRLAGVSRTKVDAKIAELMPSYIDVDWRAVTINAGPDDWWNAGGQPMIWNGAFGQRNRSASVALHEGGHTFHRLADEYGGSSTNCGEFQEVNSTADPTGAKWAHWIGFNHDPGTGLQGVYEGSRQCDTGQYRSSQDSEMNILPQPFNMISMEKIILDIYGIVRPIDSNTDNAAPITAPAALQVRVVDPAVLKVEWSVDGQALSDDGGECFSTSGLTPGNHVVTARVYDDTEWVRIQRDLLEQSVSWSVVVP